MEAEREAAKREAARRAAEAKAAEAEKSIPVPSSRNSGGGNGEVRAIFFFLCTYE
jgi:parvulin-like peptidyl-prolyl isomerase